MFAEHGFGRSTIEDVCERAGFTRGAFYSNFDSLQELFHELYTAQATGVAERVQAALNRAGEAAAPADLVAAVIDGLPLDRNWQLIKTDYLLHAARHPDAVRSLAAHQESLLTLLADALTPVMHKVRSDPRLQDPRALAQAVIAVHDGVMVNSLSGLPSSVLRDRLEATLTALVSG